MRARRATTPSSDPMRGLHSGPPHPPTVLLCCVEFHLIRDRIVPKAGTLKAGFKVPCPALLRANGKGTLHTLEVWLSPSCRLFAYCRVHGAMLFLNGEIFRHLTRGLARTKFVDEKLVGPTSTK